MPQTSQLPDTDFEDQFQCQGYSRVAGLDEVGRGCLAGPVAAGAVILPPCPPSELRAVARDSKQLSPRQRETAYAVIVKSALSYSVGWAAAAEIDRNGIVPSVRFAMRRALSKLRPAADSLLIDALSLQEVNLPQKSIIRGDSKSLSIAAASIVAKVERDSLMSNLAEEYSGYGFESHKGYGTERHMAAIRRLGPCPEHRMSFSPLNREPRRSPQVSRTEIGKWAESFVALAVEDLGMRVVDRNYSTRFGEVDLIATAGDTLVFIEVRARRSKAFATPAETVSGRKSQRLVAASHRYLQTTDIPWENWRIDVASVELDVWGRPSAVEFIESAIEE